MTTFTQLNARLKNFLRSWSLVFGLMECLVECATLCGKSEVMLKYVNTYVNLLNVLQNEKNNYVPICFSPGVQYVNAKSKCFLHMFFFYTFSDFVTNLHDRRAEAHHVQCRQIWGQGGGQSCPCSTPSERDV